MYYVYTCIPRSYIIIICCNHLTSHVTCSEINRGFRQSLSVKSLRLRKKIHQRSVALYIYISCVCPIFMLFTVSGVGIYPIYNHVYYQQLLYSFLKFQIPLTSLFPFHGIFWGVPRKKTKKQLPPRCLGHRGGIGSGSFASLLRLVNCAFKVPKSSPSCQIRTSWQEVSFFISSRPVSLLEVMS